MVVLRSSSPTYEQEGNGRGQTPKHLSPCASVKVGSGDSCDSCGDGFPWTWRLWPTPQGLKLGPLALAYSWGGRRCRQEILPRRGRCFSSSIFMQGQWLHHIPQLLLLLQKEAPAGCWARHLCHLVTSLTSYKTCTPSPEDEEPRARSKWYYLLDRLRTV